MTPSCLPKLWVKNSRIDYVQYPWVAISRGEETFEFKSSADLQFLPLNAQARTTYHHKQIDLSNRGANESGKPLHYSALTFSMNNDFELERCGDNSGANMP